METWFKYIIPQTDKVRNAIHSPKMEFHSFIKGEMQKEQNLQEE